MTTRPRRVLLGLIACALLLAACSAASAGVASMLYDGKLDVTLNDGTSVTLYPTLRSTRARPEYYYLPTNLHVALKPDGVPQFLFLKFTTEERETEGGIQGGLLHLLMEFGLTPQQEAELKAKVRAINERAEVAGVAPVEPDGETSTFQITSATLTDEGLTKSLTTSGKAPLVPGARVAAAARLTGQGAQLLAATLDKTRSITDCSMSFNLAYTTLLPAVKGTITFDWEKLAKEGQSLSQDYTHTYKTHKHWWGATHKTDHKYDYSEVREAFDYLVEKQVVKMEFEERLSDERVDKIREHFFQVFLDSFTKAQDMDTQEALRRQQEQQGDKDEDPKAPALKGDRTRWRYYEINTTKMQSSRRWILNYKLPYKQTYTLTGNLLEWYDAARSNPACVAAINLNDPFFSHRDIKFILDLDAKEMFDEAINYVTVNVRKRRSSGRAFEDHVTVDADYLSKNGVTATVTYARGDDTDPEVYDYQAQWSLKGGHVYPSSPRWERGSWEGVTLAPPVRPMTIELEGDLEAMTESDITRCTAQIHYRQFGKEAETNLHVSPAAGDPITSAKIFLDRDEENYAYRLIFNHKTAGKLAGPWVANVSDEYIYATLPEDLTASDAYTERARSLLTGKIEEVLDKLGVD